jgi:hypothetical protein
MTAATPSTHWLGPHFGTKVGAKADPLQTISL